MCRYTSSSSASQAETGFVGSLFGYILACCLCFVSAWFAGGGFSKVAVQRKDFIS
jgi:hypothetical protein